MSFSGFIAVVDRVLWRQSFEQVKFLHFQIFHFSTFIFFKNFFSHWVILAFFDELVFRGRVKTSILTPPPWKFSKYFDESIRWGWFFCDTKVWSKTHILDTLFSTIAHLEKNLSSIEKKFRQHLIIMLTSDFESTVVPKAVAKNELFFQSFC